MLNFTYIDPQKTRVDCFALIKAVEVKTSTKGTKYLDLTLSDKEGEINAKYWDYEEGVTPVFEANTIVKVRGTLNDFKGQTQLRVEQIRNTIPQDMINPQDYIASSEFSSEDMFGEIITIACGFKDEDLKNLLIATYDRYKEKLICYPAAVRLHHAMRGGLLYHSLSIMRMCQKTAELYPSVDSDLLLTGAALHDLGKIVEMDANELGIAGQYTTEGNLLGHLVVGAMLVREVAKEIGTPDEKLMLVEHMLISHHGKPEYGAAVPPKFLEAFILAKLDELDASIYEICNAVSEVEPGDFTPRQWNLDDVRLYNHGRVDELKPKANILDKE